MEDLKELFNDIIKKLDIEDQHEYIKRFNRIINSMQEKICSLCSKQLSENEIITNEKYDLGRFYKNNPILLS